MDKNLLRTKWPRVKRVLSRGLIRFLVDSRQTGFPGGRREFWDSPAEALATAEALARQRDNEGALGFAELSPTQRRDAAGALAILEGRATLCEAAQAWRKAAEYQDSLVHVPSVKEAISHYLATKEKEALAGELSRETIYDLHAKMRLVEAAFGGLKVSELDEARIRAWLRHLPHRARSKASFRTKLAQFLNYCRREGKWINSNPCENIKLKLKALDVQILELDQARALLAAAASSTCPGAIVPFLAVQLFGGLRPYEASRLDWRKIHFETAQIEVLALTSKTRETRFVPITSTLTEWLLPYRKAHGRLISSTQMRSLPAVKTAAGLMPWPKDVLRHSFASYWLAVHKDRAHLAELLGNSLEVIKRHYRRAIPEQIAKEFWKLTPSTIQRAAPAEKVVPIQAAA